MRRAAALVAIFAACAPPERNACEGSACTADARRACEDFIRALCRAACDCSADCQFGPPWPSAHVGGFPNDEAACFNTLVDAYACGSAVAAHWDACAANATEAACAYDARRDGDYLEVDACCMADSTDTEYAGSCDPTG